MALLDMHGSESFGTPWTNQKLHEGRFTGSDLRRLLTRPLLAFLTAVHGLRLSTYFVRALFVKDLRIYRRAVFPMRAASMACASSAEGFAI